MEKPLAERVKVALEEKLVQENGKLQAALKYGVGCALNELQARNLPKEWSSRSGIGVMLAALECGSTRYDDAVAALLADTDFPNFQ